MIPRYTPPEMGAIRSEEAKYQSWLDVEIYACEAWAQKGVIPKAAVKEIKKNARVDVARIEEIEAQTRHDIVAFTRQLAETIGPASEVGALWSDFKRCCRYSSRDPLVESNGFGPEKGRWDYCRLKSDGFRT